MGALDKALERVAEAITDGLPVGWDSEKAARPDLSKSLDVLRKLDLMRRIHAESIEDPRWETPALSTAQPVAASHPLRWGPLRIVEKIGEGGFGEVYRARDPILQVDVALKLFRGQAGPDGLTEEQFLDEARRLARVRHPHVLAVHGADRHDGRAGMWTDLLEGQTLEALIVNQGPLGPREAATLGMDLCGALAVIHGAGLLHRDVKTENVIRERGGRVVLLDLGCGTEIPAGGADHHTSTLRGTPAAMAPEQFQGRTAGPATDIYGLGVLLYRMVTGCYPVEATNFWELVQKISAKDYVALRDRRPDLPAEFVRVVEKAMDPDPALRFQTAGEMERALAVAAGVTKEPHGPPEPVPANQPAPLPARRTAFDSFVSHRVGWLVAAALSALVIAGVWFGSRPKALPITGVGTDAVGSSPVTGTSSATALDVKAELFRQRGDAQERLGPGSRVEPGNLLFLEVQGTRKCHVYVLAEDQQGKAFVLFPGPAFDQKNPLDAGRLHRLPGTRNGRPANWEVTSRGGDESVLVVASLEPLPELERSIAAIPAAAPDAPVEYGEVSEEAKQQLYRGIGGVKEGSSAAGAGPKALPSIMRSLPGGAKRQDGLWVWQIQLSNP